jgi:hypothetical protein
MLTLVLEADAGREAWIRAVEKRRAALGGQAFAIS